jgi:putative ABC transport system permease protein
MSLIQIAWRNFRYRPLSSFLTTLSLTLGVGLVVLVLSIYGVVSEAFTRNASVGYNLVVGPPGSKLQLTLNSVYYLSQPIENLPYAFYMEFFDQPTRAAMVQKFGGDPALGERDGKYAAHVAGGYAIPLTLGDYYGEFRVVGTTPEFFTQLRHGPDVDQPFTFAEGRAFVDESPENGYFEAVLGSRVAKQMKIRVGETFFPTHGDPDGEGHDDAFKVVGILAPTGTPNDRAAFVNMEGFYLMQGHAKPIEPTAEICPECDQPRPLDPALLNLMDDDNPLLSIPEREVTAILVRNGNIMFAPLMQNMINESRVAMAAAPIGEINKLMDQFVQPLMQVLLALTLLTCIVAAVGILVAIYNSMNDRRRDIAVMRALGARRETVTTIIIFESLIVALLGAIAGWLLAHLAIAAASGVIEDNTGVQVGFWSTSGYEWMVLPFVLALALIAALLPAWTAYRTDVASNLSA